MREVLQREYEGRIRIYEQLAATLERETKTALVGTPHIDRVVFRVKGPGSFVDKALDPANDPPYATPLVEIEDQVAGRVIVFFLQDIDIVINRLRGTFNTVESIRRRPAKDAEFGYESHHLIFAIPPHMKPAGWDRSTNMPTTFELQIRTLFMHAWAEPQHDLNYKGPTDLPSDIRRELYWVAASAWGADQALRRVLAWQQERGGGGAPSGQSK